MKKLLLSAITISLLFTGQAQVFTDDFESYAAGYLGPQSPSWTTWSGTEGGSEDVLISTGQAASGTQSIYFSSTSANGGPQDVVLLFPQVYNSDLFVFETKLFILSGKGAYFNFQGTATIGQTWAMNFTATNGSFSIDDGNTPNLATGSYPQATWFTLRIEANLSTGLWKAFVDGIGVGSWANSINTVASVDIFPLNGHNFYVDDVMFDSQPYVQPTLNAEVAGIQVNTLLDGYVNYPSVTIINSGASSITEFDVTVDYNGNQYVENITGANLVSLGSMVITLTDPVTLSVAANTMQATISNINGGNDDVLSDNTILKTMNIVVPATGKVVVGEEGTGTWCQWCPRGAVFMDKYEVDFGPYWAGIAVHNGATDPMKDAAYDAGMGTKISGYPSSLVDRGPEVDPSNMSNDFYSRVQIAPTAIITNGAIWDQSTRELKVSVSAYFQGAATSNYKIALVLTEDGVTGTTSGYNQANAYSGGGNGVMGGYELLPNPVPYSLMVYDHVARTIKPSFTGFTGSFPATVNIGETHTVNFSITLPNGWDETKMNIIGLLFAPNGRIDNAGKATISEAVLNGYVDGVDAPAGLDELTENQIDALIKVYPNPASNFATVSLNLSESAKVKLELIDISGKVLAVKDYGTLNGASHLNINTRHLNAGVYMINLTINGVQNIKRLVVE